MNVPPTEMSTARPAIVSPESRTVNSTGKWMVRRTKRPLVLARAPGALARTGRGQGRLGTLDHYREPSVRRAARTAALCRDDRGVAGWTGSLKRPLAGLRAA